MSSNMRIISLFCLWLSCVGTAFWWFQFKWLDSLPTEEFSAFAATFELGNETENPLAWTGARSELGTITIVHFIDKRCPCTKFSVPHIANLKAQLGGNVRHVQLTPEQRHGELANLVAKLPASPAVAIWGPTGALHYFGPYSSGAVCGRGEDRVSNVVTVLNQGGTARWLNQDALGCFCPWPSPRNAAMVYPKTTENHTGSL